MEAYKAMEQNEIHPYYQENDVIPYIQDLGIVIQGWYPLGGRGHTAELLGNEVISEIVRALRLFHPAFEVYSSITPCRVLIFTAVSGMESRDSMLDAQASGQPLTE